MPADLADLRAAWRARQLRTWAAESAGWEQLSRERARYRYRVAESRDWQRERERCSDVRHWLRWWVDTEDPRSCDPDGEPAWCSRPFALRPRQDALLSAILECDRVGGDLVIEKSRDEGCSWLLAAIDAHALMWRGTSTLYLSAHESLADDWTASGLLGKVWACCESTPLSLRPRPVTRSYLVVRSGYAVVRGLAAGAGIAGRRYGRVRVDEAARLDHGGWRVRTALTSLSRSRTWLSTPEGRENAFAHLRHSGAARVETVLWSSNPSKACDHAPEEPHATCWYAQEVWGMPRADIASQLDCSYDASIAGQIWPRLSRTTHQVDDDIRWARLLADYPGRWLVGVDVGVGPSATAAVLCRWSPVKSALLVDWACEWWQATAFDVGFDLGTELVRRKIQSPILVDPSAWARDPTQRSWAAHAEDGLRKAGYRGGFQRAGAQSDRSTIDAIDMLTAGRTTAGTGLLRFGPRAERAFSRAVAYRWRQGPGVVHEVRDGQIVGISGHSGDPSPRKDEASHLSDALQNVAQATLLQESLPQRYVGRV